MLIKNIYVFEYAELSKRYNFNINFNVIQSAMLGNLIEAADRPGPNCTGQFIFYAKARCQYDQRLELR